MSKLIINNYFKLKDLIEVLKDNINIKYKLNYFNK
jgi:hypothetical protein